ncbi:MAG: PilT/PilU family type 4a pilus ATPase [Terriglobales bacterium]
MAAPGSSPIAIAFEGISGAGSIPTPVLLGGMLSASEKVSDLIFSPGRPPQVEIHGQLTAVEISGSGVLSADDTRRIAADLIGTNKQAINTLREQGSCDVSYGLPGMARFRVNVFIQRGSCAIVMRVIPTVIPTFSSLRLPAQLEEVAKVRNGIILVTGGTGSGKSSTLAALIDRINSQYCYHVLTVEDPIEFLHKHKKSTVHQRELHSDAPNFTMALRAALRQAPRVIMVGEIRDRETLEILLEAAENGHLVLSSINTVDTSKAVERIVGTFPISEQQAVRGRLAKTFRYIIAQRLIPRSDGGDRIAVVEILKSNSRTRDCVEQGEHTGRTLLDAIKASENEGMQHFDGEIAKIVRSGVVDLETGLCFASNATVLGQELAR